MKKYRITYWVGSIMTDTIVKADSEQSAIAKFYTEKGRELFIFSIGEVK